MIDTKPLVIGASVPITLYKHTFQTDLANFIFLLLFPGFFFYSFAVAKGYLPALPGGWFGTVSIFCLLSFLPFTFLSIVNSKGKCLYFLLLFCLLLFFIGAWGGIHYLLGYPWHQKIDALKALPGVIFLWFIFFFVGYFASPKKWFVTILFFSFLGMVYLVLVNIDPTRMIFYAKVQFAVKEGVATYQGFARSFAVTAILMLGFANRAHHQTAIIILTSLVLYFLGARSEFFAFISIIFLVAFGTILRSSVYKKILIASILALLIALFFWVQTTEYSNRQLEVLKLSKSSSISARIEFFKEGWSHIVKSPILGDYAGQLREGEFGSYIHNGLSVWRQFGIFGFGLYFGLSIISLFVAFNSLILNGKNKRIWVTALYLNFYSFILIVAAKSVFSSLAPLAWGYSLNAYMQDRKKPRIKSAAI